MQVMQVMQVREALEIQNTVRVGWFARLPTFADDWSRARSKIRSVTFRTHVSCYADVGPSFRQVEEIAIYLLKGRKVTPIRTERRNRVMTGMTHGRLKI